MSRRARLLLDRPTLAALAAGLVMLQLLVFSAGFLLGAADGVQALAPPEPPVLPSVPSPIEWGQVRLASLLGGGFREDEPPPPVPPGPEIRPARVPAARPAPAAAVSRQERPSPLATAYFILPPPPPQLKPKLKAERRVAPVRRLPRTAEVYAAMIREAADRHSVSPALVEAIARVESGFNSRAVSHKGARGLMQVMPATGRRFGVRSDRLFDPEHNLTAGVAYLAWLSKRYRGNLDFIVAAYNAGEGAVDDHGGIPPYRETRNYVRRVRAALRSIEEKALPAEPRPDQSGAVPTPIELKEEESGPRAGDPEANADLEPRRDAL